MIEERGIKLTWVEKTLDHPEKVEYKSDGTQHFLRRIPEHGNRWLRVIVNKTERKKKR
jgi:hypothetical protein